MAVFRQHIERDVTQYRTASLDEMFATVVKPQYIRRRLPRMSGTKHRVECIHITIIVMYCHGKTLRRHPIGEANTSVCE